MPQPVEIFFSYAHEDEELMNDVRRQLIVYDRQRVIVKWHDRLIPAGGAWAGEIDDRLRRARVILLFVSPHFIESKYCYEVEMAEALRRHEAGGAVVIPIILRPCPWGDSPLGHLQALPKDGRAVTLWPNRDEACLNVAEGVMRVVRGLDDADMNGEVRAGRESHTSMPHGPGASARPLDLRRHRLEAEAEQMRKLVERVPSIEIVETEGSPAALYLLKYHMDGVVGIDEDGSPRIGKEHLVELRLHDDYPMSLPFARFITPIFHPNVSEGGNVCMGWFGIPYNLPDICVHIGKIIDYQIYKASSPPSPADMRAAEWAKKHSTLFPLTDWAGFVRAPAKADTAGIKLRLEEQRTVEFSLLIQATGERHSVTAPVDIRVRELKSFLLRELGLPLRFENGLPVTYKLRSRSRERMLLDDSTLRENGVSDGDVLVFAVEMVAG